MHLLARAAMAATTAMQRETVGLVVVAVLAGLVRLLLRLLSAGDEGRQPVDVAVGGGAALLRARQVRLVLLGLRKRLGVARDIGLRLARAEW